MLGIFNCSIASNFNGNYDSVGLARNNKLLSFLTTISIRNLHFDLILCRLSPFLECALYMTNQSYLGIRKKNGFPIAKCTEEGSIR